MTMTQTEVNVPVDGTITSAKLSGDLVTPSNLTVTGTATMDGLTVVNDSTNEGFSVKHSNNTAGIGIGYNTIQATGTNTNQSIYLMSKGDAPIITHTNGSERLRIDSSGNVGIGTSSPSSFSDTQLMVRNNLDNAGIGIATGQSGKSARLRFFDNLGNQDATIGIEGTGNALFFTTVGGGESMRIDSSGNTFLQTDGAALQWKNGYQTITGDAASNDLTYRTYANHIWKTTTGASSTTDGSERMRIDSSGTIKSSVNGAVANLILENDADTPYILFTESGAAQFFIGESSIVGGGAGYYDFYAVTGLGQRFFTNSVERMRIDSSGNLTTRQSTGNNFRVIRNGDNSVEVGNYNATDGYQNTAYISSTHTFYAGTAGAGGASRAVDIDSSGNVIVGTTNLAPVSNNVQGVSIRSFGELQSSRDGAATLYLNRKTNDGDIVILRKDGADVGSIGSEGGNSLYIANDDAGLRFSGGSNCIIPCGVAGASSDGLLDLGLSGLRFKDLYLSGKAIVGAGSASAPSITASNDTDAGLFWGGGFLGFTGGSGNQMRLDSSGNLLVGTSSTNPNYGFRFLPLAGNSYAEISHNVGSPSGTSFAIFRYNQGVIGSIGQHGTSQVLYNTSSDQRLKENIADADDAGSKVDAIQVRKFDWKADGSHQDYGMIAQELQTVAPEAVSGDADSEDMMGVDYSKLVPMLIKEIQSLRNRVAQLEA